MSAENSSVPEPKKRMSGFAKLPRILVWALFVWILLRVFFFQIMQIPSSSMRMTFCEGDYIVVNKLALGARFPMTPLTSPFGSGRAFLDWIRLPYMRLPGYTRVCRNDVLVFNLPTEDEYPVDLRTPYIKRCVALPGDSFCIKEGRLWLNGKFMSDPEGVEYNYRITLPEGSGTYDHLLSEVDEKPERSADGSHCSLIMTPELAGALIKSNTILSAERITENEKKSDPQFFPHDFRMKWNGDNVGPLKIPKKGDSVRINTENLSLYKRLIENYEGSSIDTKSDSVFINHKYARFYRFKQDYYYTIGDNRSNSIDSRFWGFLPESHLIGRVSFVLYSNRKALPKKS